MRQKKTFENKYPYRITYITQRGIWNDIDFMARSDAEAIEKLNSTYKWSWIEYAVYQWRYMGNRKYRWLRIYPPKINYI